MKQRIGQSAWWLDVGVALLATAAATLARLALEPLLEPGAIPFNTYFPAVLLVAWLRGWNAGLLALVLGTVVADYCFVRPFGGFIPDQAHDWMVLAVFVVVGVGMAWLGDSQKRAVTRATQERQRFETTLASIGDAVIATDAEGRIVFANPVARSLLRCPQELVGQDLQDVFRILHEETRAPVENPVTKVLREGVVVALANHTALLAGDGTEIPIDDTAAPIKDGEGRVVGAVLVFRDIGERRRAQRARRLLAAIVESTSDAIVSKDLEGNITSWNAGAERIFGYTEKEVMGRPVSILAVPGGNEMPMILERIRRGERIEHYETVRRTKAGETLHVSLSVSPLLDDDGRVIGASKIVRDISERRRALEALQRSNEDLERFAFMASHDLQEPLRMITAYGQLLSRSLSLPREDERQEFLGQILDGAGRLRALITDLLAYTRIRQEPEQPSALVELNAVLAAVRNNLKRSIEESGAEVVAGDLPQVRGHEAHFISLLQNLVENAIKYRSDASPRIQVSAERKDGEIEVAVADNGVGIPPEYREQIFQVFRRLHGSAIPGTGVGLAICQRVVQRYGGRIWVEAGEKQGTTFRFALPADAPEDAPRV